MENIFYLLILIFAAWLIILSTGSNAPSGGSHINTDKW